jgi:hypothetical protein
LGEYATWYREKFGEARPEWYVFPFGNRRPSDPTRSITTFKTAWRNVRKDAKVIGRPHDKRHTLITELAESGAGDQTIMDIAGHVSKRMLRHSSHLRMEAKRTALESIVKKQSNGNTEKKEDSQAADGAKRAGYPQRVRGSRSGPAEKSKLKTECSESPTITQDFEGRPTKIPTIGHF